MARQSRGPCLREIVDDADIFLDDLLGLEDDTAAVGGNIELVSREGAQVVEVVEEGDAGWDAGKS